MVINMYDICIFAGTTEGRRLAEELARAGLSMYVCVATEYGEALIPKGGNVTVSARRLSKEDMLALFESKKVSIIVDATHPYAVEASQNIKAACAQAGAEYMRLSRGESERDERAVYVSTIEDASRYLKGTEGAILAATGSKELEPYTEIENYRERLFARVLPMPESLSACAKIDLPPSHVIAMQGTFSKEMNLALIRAAGAKYLVTKDSGASGGFLEKLAAARESGITCVVIGRPPESAGEGYLKVLRALLKRFDREAKPEVSIVGIGMGNPALMTKEAADAVNEAECVIGAARVIEAAAKDKPRFEAMDGAKILAFIKEHPEYRRIAVLMSGDTGFFSGAKKLLPQLKAYSPKIYPGISSLQYLSSRVAVSWDDARIISLHGRDGSAVPYVAENKKVFALVGGSGAVNKLCAELCEAGLSDVLVTAGERLSYDNEKITTGSAGELKDMCFDPLCAVLIRNKNALPARRAWSLPDDAFIRNAGGKVVPMTKSEIRAISLAKLMLEPDSIAYDIGAGTGSVSVEMAGVCRRGQVYAIECRKDACDLILQNRRRFGLNNLTVVEGSAPEACEPLPAPTHAFLGGTSGSMGDIIDALLKKNPYVRIVINLVTLESITEMIQCLKKFGFDDAEITQVTVAKSKKLGSHRLMNGQNPIMIITCQKTEGGKEQK